MYLKWDLFSDFLFSQCLTCPDPPLLDYGLSSLFPNISSVELLPFVTSTSIGTCTLHKSRGTKTSTFSLITVDFFSLFTSTWIHASKYVPFTLDFIFLEKVHLLSDLAWGLLAAWPFLSLNLHFQLCQRPYYIFFFFFLSLKNSFALVRILLSCSIIFIPQSF